MPSPVRGNELKGFHALAGKEIRVESAVTPLVRGDGRRLSGGCDAGGGAARRRQRRERAG